MSPSLCRFHIFLSQMCSQIPTHSLSETTEVDHVEKDNNDHNKPQSMNFCVFTWRFVKNTSKFHQPTIEFHHRLEFLLWVIHFQHEAHALWKIKCWPQLGACVHRKGCCLLCMEQLYTIHVQYMYTVHSTCNMYMYLYTPVLLWRKHRQMRRKDICNKLLTLMLRRQQHSSVRLMKSGTDFVRNLTLAQPAMARMHEGMTCKVRLGKWNLGWQFFLPTSYKKRWEKENIRHPKSWPLLHIAHKPFNGQPAQARIASLAVSWHPTLHSETCTWSQTCSRKALQRRIQC